MDKEWHIRQHLELLSAPTCIPHHQASACSSVVDGVRRVRRILAGDDSAENERLIRACARNDIETVQWLLDNDEIGLVNSKKGGARFPLHEAVLHRHGRPLVQLLCQHGADPKERDSLGRTPIHYAASCGHTPMMIDLVRLSRVPMSSMVDSEGRCPLMYACGEGHLSTSQWLIEHGGSDPLRRDDHGRSCLTYASRAGHSELVEWLLPISSLEPTHTGWYPLHFACSNGHLNVVKVLLRAASAQGGQAVMNTGHSALFVALHSLSNNVEIVNCLLDSHPSVRLTPQDIEDLNCDKSLVLLLAQRCHSLVYLPRLLKRLNYPLSLVRLLLLSEHTHCIPSLLALPQLHSFVYHHLKSPLTLKQISRRLIRQSIETNHKMNTLDLSQSLQKFLRFEYFN